MISVYSKLTIVPKQDPKDGWKGAQRMMSDAGFLQKLLTYDKDVMNPKWAKAGTRIIWSVRCIL